MSVFLVRHSYGSSNMQDEEHQNISKRTMDVILAFMFLPFAACLLLPLAFIIKRDGGPAFFSQIRIGKNGKAFRMYKLRTMVPNANTALSAYLAQNPDAKTEYNSTHKLKQDPRITWIGKYLRQYSIDELPQLYNVLRGDMSVVGPRPIVRSEMHYYKDKIQDYVSVQPGLTGLWQVSGRNDTSYAERVALDCKYVQTRTLLKDIEIIFRTIFVILNHKGAY